MSDEIKVGDLVERLPRIARVTEIKLGGQFVRTHTECGDQRIEFAKNLRVVTPETIAAREEAARLLAQAIAAERDEDGCDYYGEDKELGQFVRDHATALGLATEGAP